MNQNDSDVELSDYLDKKERFDSKCDHEATDREIFHGDLSDPDSPNFD